METSTSKQKVDRFCNFLYNAETGQLLGRGAKSWGKIVLFYLVYYMCLSGFFAATIAVYCQPLKAAVMGYRPMPDVGTTLIHVIDKNAQIYKDNINSILQKYDDESQKDLADCSSNYKTRPGVAGRIACRFTVDIFEKECGEYYGYKGDNPQPCVLLKFNEIYNWEPDQNPNAPDELVICCGDAYNQNKMWIHCVGENGADKDNIGQVTYIEEQGFPLYYFPYLNQTNYKAPLVMVKFLNPTKGIGLMIECTAFAKNLDIDGTFKRSVKFELLVGE